MNSSCNKYLNSIICSYSGQLFDWCLNCKGVQQFTWKQEKRACLRCDLNMFVNFEQLKKCKSQDCVQLCLNTYCKQCFIEVFKSAVKKYFWGMYVVYTYFSMDGIGIGSEHWTFKNGHDVNGNKEIYVVDDQPRGHAYIHIYNFVTQRISNIFDPGYLQFKNGKRDGKSVRYYLGLNHKPNEEYYQDGKPIQYINYHTNRNIYSNTIYTYDNGKRTVKNLMHAQTGQLILFEYTKQFNGQQYAWCGFQSIQDQLICEQRRNKILKNKLLRNKAIQSTYISQ